MTVSDKNSENIFAHLAEALNHLRRQQGIVIYSPTQSTALYPAEFLNENSKAQANITQNPLHIQLAKRAGLIPLLAIITPGQATKGWQVYSEEKLKTALAQTGRAVFEISRAQLPIEDAENSTLATFREEGEEMVHLALIIGKPSPENNLPLVRVHSSCITGDLLGSLRCDCGDQLKLALSAIKQSGYGILLYMNQEGRGIGITNKIRAYELQEKGLDTYEANHALGFGSDERDFSIAASILKQLGTEQIKLLSNNPHKIAELKRFGININQSLPLIAETGKHNQAYIDAKSKKAGHKFGNIENEQ